MILQEIEYEILENTINNKIYDYINKYMQNPNYIKVPLWIYECMKVTMRKMQTNYIRIDYTDELIKYRGLIICPTISIEKPDEIEVF